MMKNKQTKSKKDYLVKISTSDSQKYVSFNAGF